MAKRKAIKTKTGEAKRTTEVANYGHPEASSPARPAIGAQAHYERARPPAI